MTPSDDMYADDRFSTPPPESQNQPSSSKKHRAPPPVGHPDYEGEDDEMEAIGQRMDTFHIAEERNGVSAKKTKRTWYGKRKN